MMRRNCLLVVLMAFPWAVGMLMASPLADLPEIKPRTIEYKSGRSLLVYAPTGTNAGLRPVAVFIHGGGWAQGNPEQFALHSRYYAARGLVGISVGYCLAKPPATTVLDCVADVKSAVRWIRKHAGELGVDPARIVVLGDSAGGHLAAATALLPGLDAPDDDLTVSARPDVLVLFNPVIDTTPPDGWDLKSQGALVVARAADLSPMDHVSPGAPPTLVIHGSADTVTPLAGSERFVAAMRAAGNTARLETLADKGHAFIVPGYGDNATLARALKLTDDFLTANQVLGSNNAPKELEAKVAPERRSGMLPDHQPGENRSSE
ncbi:MAG: alpha/beta hydrolase [bacterium]